MKLLIKFVDSLEAGLAACENNIGKLFIVSFAIGAICMAILFWFMVHPL